MSDILVGEISVRFEELQIRYYEPPATVAETVNVDKDIIVTTKKEEKIDAEIEALRLQIIELQES